MLLAAALAGAAASVMSDGGSRPRPFRDPARPASSQVLQPPSSLFAREPAMGVACRAPNSIACDRVLFGVWLRRPAVAVYATIDGRSLKLDDREWSGLVRNGRRTLFVGALQPAGLLNGPLKVHPDRGRYYWAGKHPVFAHVRVVVHYGHGATASTAFDVQLGPGWG